jgi:hypothetical protein
MSDFLIAWTDTRGHHSFVTSSLDFANEIIRKIPEDAVDVTIQVPAGAVVGQHPYPETPKWWVQLSAYPGNTPAPAERMIQFTDTGELISERELRAAYDRSYPSNTPATDGK